MWPCTEPSAIASSDSPPQLDLGFEPGDPVALAPASKASKRAKASAVRAAPVGVPVNLTPQAMAEALQQHPDYRVLRRLQPTTRFAPATGPVSRVALLDTETTGLESARDKIIELALLVVDVERSSGRPCGEVLVYDGLEDPGMPISPEIEAITGINNAMVQGQRLDEARIAELLQGVELVVAHNAAFDRPFVEARLPAFAQLPWACSFADLDWKALGHGSAKLESLAQDFGWFYDAHRAEVDCHALLAVLAAPLPDAKPAATGLSAMLRAADAMSYRLQATGAPFDAKDLLKARGYRWSPEQKVWHTRLNDQTALVAECDWLKAHVYGQRAARVQIEALDARTRYAARAGLLSQQVL